MQVFHHKGWELLSFIEKSKGLELFQLIDEKRYRVNSILKSDQRSEVVTIKFYNETLVLKIPKQKNLNRWIRFTTLYRQGESFRCFCSLKNLMQLSLPTAKPILAAERRISGMVTNSWFIYRYIPGENCLDKKDFYPGVIQALKQLHEKNLLHGDPQIRNFILSEDLVVHMIDAKLKSPSFSFFSYKHEWAYLAKSAPGIEEFYCNINTPIYQLAKAVDRMFRRFVRMKRKVIYILKN